ncbi:L-arabonate dehydratase [Tsuneonella dongtanensis]|uniref:L-arabonate dehydratase n=1 Tax=Tsuneonella dongtanensis TaxID=692370 RepID=A0A1B2AB14_9SPHN|nr:IlvD/Edd family dehydratase [Tsuneonella dongtanensis]ANY19357.1 L-arabonate dehydratase [Tsuneonella dongtanensis]
MAKEPRTYRSAHSYGKDDKDGFLHRSWMKAQGFPEDVFDGRPVIGICNTWSEITPCNSHLREVADYVKRGVWERGGLPLEFPALSLGETQVRPTAMLFRNLLAMEVEESIRMNPIDGVVLLGGCDKTTPGQMMGAASVDLPTIVVSSGPMLTGKFQGRDIGSGTEVWRFSEEVRAGTMTMDEFKAAEAAMSRSRGVCMTMGSASSFAAVAEGMGLALPHNAATPGVEAGRFRIGHLAGRAIVDLVRADAKMSQFLTRKHFENGIRVHAAMGGSTNSIIHLLALAGRCGVDLTLDDFDVFTRDIPLLANISPSGDFHMEDLHYAGGVPAVMKELESVLHLDVPTVGGTTIGDCIADARVWNRSVIGSLAEPAKELAGTWVLRGNLAPGGAIMKPSAASPELLSFEGRAVVFDTIEDYKARVDDPDLDIDETCVMVLRNCGIRGYPGMPEVANMALPKKLLGKGVRDMVRVSDARMSGTAFGTVVLHVTPEADVGGPLALVRDGDVIRLDAPNRALELLVPDDELERRAREWSAEDRSRLRGYLKMHDQHVLQADKGCDLDFLQGSSGDVVERESH